MRFIFEKTPSIHLPENMDAPIVKELLSNYTYGTAWSVLYDAKEGCITAGDFTEASLEDAEFVINADAEGIYLRGGDYSSTMRGFFALLDKIKYSEEDGSFYVEEGVYRGSPALSFRAAHLCIFPETTLDFLQKCVRSCALARYSHIVFEFWGTIQYDCMKELAWPFAYTKEQLREIVREANALGLEIIPMLNHLGHASACREKNGKHVVLDQNPKYEYMFESYGWVWKFERKDVYELLGKMRDELIDVCGPGSYFHLGCDEAYSFGHDVSRSLKMVEYVNRVAEDLRSKGRRAIIWHDMFLSAEENPGYFANATKAVADAIIDKLDRGILIADWQYGLHEECWSTSKKLKEKGFDVVVSPWDNNQNVEQAVNTAKEYQLLGVMHTTWHTLFSGFREMVYAGMLSYGIDEKSRDEIARFYAAHLARKVMPSGGEYEKTGWSEKMMGPGL